jgi:hypothetical protein
MYSQIVIVALSGYPPGVNKLYCIVSSSPRDRGRTLLATPNGIALEKVYSRAVACMLTSESCYPAC